MQKVLLMAAVVWLATIFSLHAQTGSATDSNVYCAVKKDGKWGYIDKAGKVAIPYYFDEAFGFSEGLAPVRIGKKWGYIGRDGKFRLNPVFENVHNFHNGRALVGFLDPQTKTVVNGFITHAGEMILVLPDNQFGYDFHDNLARVRLDQGPTTYFGFVDTMGQWVMEPKFELAMDFNEGAAPVYYKGKWGFIELKGHVIIEPKFDLAFNFHENRAYVEMGNKSTYIDGTGTPVLPELMTDIDFTYNEGLTGFKKNGKIGFMDRSGIEIIPAKFDNPDFTQFSEGLVKVAVKDAKGGLKWGFADKTGNVVIPMQFQSVKDFHYGVAVAQQDGKFGVINTKGAWIVKPVYEEALGYSAYY
jgi:hypothetical protein